MKYKPYPAYKDSGLDWLGEIPTHWEVRRLKTIASVELSNVDKKSIEGQVPVGLCNYVDVYYNERISNRIDFMSATATPEQARRFSLRPGDVLITKDSESWTDIAVPSVVVEELHGVLCGYHLALIRPSAEELDGRFLARAFAAIGPRDQFQISANGITRFGLSGDAICAGVFPVPPLSEQRVIADFLDRETGRIDALVTKKERLIELLQEKRAALITRAVTKGLPSAGSGQATPNAPMKDSGVEWFGQIPAHWNIKRLKWLTSRVDVGIAEAATHAYVEVGVPIIRSTNVKPNRIERDDLLQIEKWFAEKNRSKYLDAGDLVTVRTGNPGTTAVVPTELNGSQCFTLLISTPRKGQVPEFLCHWLNSQGARVYFELEGWGSAQTNISVPILQNLPCSEPPLDEQFEIVTYIRREALTIGRLVEQAGRAIDRLKEYRTALISAAVTGKIDVRDAAV